MRLRLVFLIGCLSFLTACCCLPRSSCGGSGCYEQPPSCQSDCPGSECQCVDPGCTRNPCLNFSNCCEVFGNIAGEDRDTNDYAESSETDYSGMNAAYFSEINNAPTSPPPMMRPQYK